MSQILTSHSTFKTRNEVTEHDATTHGINSEESNARPTNPVDAPASKPSESPMQDSETSSEGYDEFISDEELDDELETAEDQPYICESKPDGLTSLQISYS